MRKKTRLHVRSFSVPEADPTTPAVIDNAGGTIRFTLRPGTDPASLTPSIALFCGDASVNPATGVPQNFRAPVAYTVSSGGDEKSFTASVVRPAASAKDVPGGPKNLGFYYAWPSGVNQNGGSNVAAAIAFFKQFDIVVFGENLWTPAHGDRANAITIIAALKAVGIRTFGYVSVHAEANPNLSAVLTDAQVRQAVDGWVAMGVDGVFGDNFGSDFGVTRSRQNVLVDYAHGKDLAVFANGHDVEDVLGGADCHLNKDDGDYYLLESFMVSESGYTDLSANIAKANLAYYYMRVKGIGIACVARDQLANISAATPQTAKFKMAWYATAMYNFDAFQYSDKNYGSNSDRMFFFPNPTVAYGANWTDYDWVRKVSANQYERTMGNGKTLFITGSGINPGTGGVY